MSQISKYNNLDKIEITNLEIFAYHGVFPEENEKGQYFYIDADLYVDTRKAGKTDNLFLTVHYGEVCHFMYEYMTKNTHKILETIAEHMTKALLIEFPLVESMRLKIKKPHAPIGLNFENVSLEVFRGWNKVHIGLGSNLGDKKDYIDQAVSIIEKNKFCRNIKVSNLILTKPYGSVEQDDFLNGVLEMQTLLDPDDLLDFLHTIEKDAKRERTIFWGPRTLDLDILFFGDEIIEYEDLIVPHADMHNREFVLKPMMELAPRKIHPVFGKTIIQLYKDLTD